MSKTENSIIGGISSNNSWTYENFSMIKENDQVHLQIKNVKMTIPLSKFEKLKDQQSGKFSVNKYTFEIPKLRNKDGGDLSFSITTPDKKTVFSEPMSVVHHNTERWRSFVDFLLGQHEIFSIYYDQEDKKWFYRLANQAKLDNELNKTKSDFPAYETTMFCSDVEYAKSMVLEYINKSPQKVITDNLEVLEQSLQIKLPTDRVFDVEKFYGVTFQERRERVIHLYGDNPVILTGFAGQKGGVLNKTYYSLNYLPTKPSAQDLENQFMFGKYLDSPKKEMKEITISYKVRL